MQPEASRDAWLKARKQSDGSQLLELLGDADERFFEQLETIVNAALKHGPVALPFKVLGEIAIAPPDESALPQSGKPGATDQTEISHDRTKTAKVYLRRWRPNNLPGNASVRSSIANLFATKIKLRTN